MITEEVTLDGTVLAVEYEVTSQDGVTHLVLSSVRAVDNLLPLLDRCYLHEGDVMNPLMSKICVQLTSGGVHGPFFLM